MSIPLSRRAALLGAGGLIGLSALAACSPKPAAGGLAGVTLRSATYRGNPEAYFKQAGVDDTPYQLTRSQFASGNLIAEAINARALDIGGMSEIPPIFVAGSPSNLVRIVAVLKGDVNNQVILVPPGSAIRSIADLKGKRVGYVRATTSHYILLKVLEEAGLNWGDITPSALSPQDGLAAFQRGSLDAWVIFGVIVQQAIRGGARVLTTAMGRLSGNYLVAASAEAIADPGKHKAISDYLQRYRKTLAWINADDDRWASLLAADTGIPKALYLEQLRQRSAPSELVAVSDAAVTSEQAVSNAFAKAGVIPSAVAVAPIWDRSFADALR
jgi:sulfonate transport system substrate-binding protein